MMWGFDVPGTDTHRLVDYLGITGENVMQCTCGVRIWPASAVTTMGAWDRHLKDVALSSDGPGAGGFR